MVALLFTLVVPAPLFNVGHERPDNPITRDLVVGGDRNRALLQPLRLGEPDLLLQFEPYRAEFMDDPIVGVRGIAIYTLFFNGLIAIAALFCTGALLLLPFEKRRLTDTTVRR